MNVMPWGKMLFLGMCIVAPLCAEADDASVKCEASSQTTEYFGEWFPRESGIFKAPTADPRIAAHSVGLRLSDSVISHTVGAVSLGLPLPLYRWHNIEMFGGVGDMQLDLEPAVWSVFDIGAHSAPLINADYFVSLNLSYALEKWSFRGRLYHLSTHLGDEYILNNGITKDTRLNVSNEVIDVMASYSFSDSLRLFGGVGYIVQSDRDFSEQSLYVEYGGEAFFGEFQDHKRKLLGRPFLAIYLKNKEFLHWNKDANYCVGYEWSKLDGIGKKTRLVFEYHDGYSEEGQFQRERTQYATLKLMYSY